METECCKTSIDEVRFLDEVCSDCIDRLKDHDEDMRVESYIEEIRIIRYGS